MDGGKTSLGLVPLFKYLDLATQKNLLVSSALGHFMTSRIMALKVTDCDSNSSLMKLGC